MAGRILTALLTYLGVALYYVGAGPLIRWLGRKNPKVLLYHDCADHETLYVAGLDCTTAPNTFERHLEYIQRHHTVVPLETLVAGKAPDSAVALTFDDGYRSVYVNAFPILKRRQLPATLYLITNAVGNEEMVWVNELNHALRTDPQSTRKIVAEYFEISKIESAGDVISNCRLNYEPSKMAKVLHALRERSGKPIADRAREASLYVDWNEVAEMEENAITFGNHTMTHPNMERLDENEQRREILGAHEKLLPRLKRVHSFAHPFGHRGSKAAEIAEEAGALCSVDVGGRTERLDRCGLAGCTCPISRFRKCSPAWRSSSRSRSGCERLLNAMRARRHWATERLRFSYRKESPARFSPPHMIEQRVSGSTICSNMLPVDRD